MSRRDFSFVTLGVAVALLLIGAGFFGAVSLTETADAADDGAWTLVQFDYTCGSGDGCEIEDGSGVVGDPNGDPTEIQNFLSKLETEKCEWKNLAVASLNARSLITILYRC